MKLYYCLFCGHEPVGACLTVSAKNKTEALVKVQNTLSEMNLLSKNTYLTEECMIHLLRDDGKVTVLLDGDY